MKRMKRNLQKSWLYKYIRYRLERECFKDAKLQGASREQKDSICLKAVERTRSYSFLFAFLYLPAFSLFFFGWIMNPRNGNNEFVSWYLGVIESVVPLVTGDWGSSWNEKRGAVLLIFFRLIPIFIVSAAPLFLPILITANRVLKKTIQESMLGILH